MPAAPNITIGPVPRQLVIPGSLTTDESSQDKNPGSAAQQEVECPPRLPDAKNRNHTNVAPTASAQEPPRASELTIVHTTAGTVGFPALAQCAVLPIGWSWCITEAQGGAHDGNGFHRGGIPGGRCRSSPPGPATEHPGGSPLNVAVGLARLGRRTQLATRFADDNHGQIVRDHVESNGIQLCPSSDEALTTATATARLASDGQASYHFDLTWDLPRLDIPDEAIVVHTGSIASWTAPGRDHVRDVMGRAKEQATVTYDPNVRPDLLDDPESARPLIESCVSRADVVKASDEDLHWLHPGDDLRTIARHWLDLGPSLMVITCGGSGILALTDRGLSLSIPSHPAKVVDTVGPGTHSCPAFSTACGVQNCWGSSIAMTWLPSTRPR